MTPSLLRVMIGAIGAVLLFAGTAMADQPQPIPEPASATLLALGGAGMYLLKRWRRE